MLNTTYPYVQASGNQVVDMLEKLIDTYTSITAIIGALLLVLLICLCIAELRQPARVKRAGGSLSKRPAGAKRHGERRLLESSSI
ncbi:MAG TPA: hypothetical protein VKA60_12350 [Blastocatellia bacterium]|nr:hypothetical protein [Blastocatellia bacterium]